MDQASGHHFRPDIQGLRAVAVILVVAFHARFAHFDGGFIGVDVFFVLSGFLITRLLLDERSRTGTVSLPGFWSRRARRLLPAACLTLVVTLVAAQFVLPALQRREVTIDAFFSAVFLANVRFAETLGDYFGNQLAETYPSPFLHFWSLAVEEQFYLVWPVVVLVAMRVGRRPRRTLALVAVPLAVISFAISVSWTPKRPEDAFYLLPARMCELLAGALLAIAGPPLLARIPGAARSALGWAGLAGIGLATVTFSETSAFPGYLIALPVLATVALLAAGAGPPAPYGPQRLLSSRPMLWIGGLSYAIYLWHWPALVLFQAHDPSGSLAQRLLAIALSVVLAELSMRFVENPVRYTRWLARPARRGLALGLGLTAGAVAVVGVVWVTQPSLDGGGEEVAAVSLEPVVAPSAGSSSTTQTPSPDEETVQPSDGAVSPATTATTGSEGRAPSSRLAELEDEMREILDVAAETTDVPDNLRPSLLGASRDYAQVYPDGCITLGESAEVLDCRYGVVGSATKIMLFGDSHAAHWFPAMEEIATARGAELVVMFKGGCPVADVPSTRPDLIATCPIWRDAAIARAIEVEPELVVTSSLSGYTTDEEQWQAGLTDVLGKLQFASEQVVVLLDTPRANGAPPVCLSDNLRSADNCVALRTHAVQSERASVERAAAESVDARVVDPVPWLCGQAKCPVIVGDALMYRDVDHITTAASVLLAPLLDAALYP